MDFAYYEKSGHTLYQGLAEVIVSILKAAIAQDQSLRPQQFQHRAKEISSLRRKLERAQATENDEVEQHAKDLAGARVIFYTNSDVSSFQNSGILTDNFEVDWGRTKFHYPTSPSPTASELFESNNYVVRLKSERSSLPEYARYKDFWCEVQIQTTLNHAWAEMAHDTIYKKPSLSGFGGSLMKGIESRMQSIMRDYLAPAGYAFQKVLADFDRLAHGQELFEVGIISAIEQANDNNELHEVLTKFSSSVLPYCDNYESTSNDLIASVAVAVKKVRDQSVQPIETPFGNLSGKTSEDVANAAAGIIGYLWFVDIDKTFTAICELYLGSVRTDEAAIWIKLAKKLAEHDLEVWKQAGSFVQSILIQRIVEFTDEEKVVLKPVILPMLEEFFSTELSATTSSFDSMTIHSGSVPPSDELRDIRQKSLNVIKEFDTRSNNDDEQRMLIKVYASAMRLPNFGQPINQELAAIVFDNAAEIIERYALNIESWSYELRQKVEHDMLWLYRHYGSVETIEAAEVAHARMIAGIQSFRKNVNADESFTTYKLLVGFESVFPPAWDDPDFEYEQEEQFRKECIEKIVQELTNENFDKWLGIIRRCAATESQDLATSPTFAAFLEKLSAAKPEIALHYLNEIDDKVASFLAPILRGLEKTSCWKEAEAIIVNWVAEGRFLSEIAWSFGSVESISITILESSLDQAIARDDITALFSVIQSIGMRNNDQNAKQLKIPFLKAIAFMNTKEEPRWINRWFTREKPSALLLELDQSETTLILQSLIRYTRVESRMECFLADIANTFPLLVINYFGDRLKRRHADQGNSRHDAIPSSLDKLRKVLSNSPKLVIDAAREWHALEPEYFSYYGGKFVKTVFPNFPAIVESLLGDYVDSGDRQNMIFVLDTLRAYSGESFLYPMCQRIISVLESDDQMLAAVEAVIQPRGTTSGEFGHVERLKRTRETIAAWSSDERVAVSTFATHYVKKMELSIAAEQRRSKESVALRKMEFNESEADEFNQE
jgi:ppGpp synthetase/RelA/SpoT-type nucleotidyltranferase